MGMGSGAYCRECDELSHCQGTDIVDLQSGSKNHPKRCHFVNFAFIVDTGLTLLFDFTKVYH